MIQTKSRPKADGVVSVYRDPDGAIVHLRQFSRDETQYRKVWVPDRVLRSAPDDPQSRIEEAIDWAFGRRLLRGECGGGPGRFFCGLAGARAFAGGVLVIEKEGYDV